ncbi:Laccase-1 [Lachnellula suecica]|uniref:Laccase-1 n=1 Tax=Lachnellula suecica TaxID=602035 RepID=A0A8T9CEW8_9HELO|nr:Laccase-1 [Lachnellula suecica]
MAPYDDKRSPYQSDDLEHVEMQERDDSFDGEQEERLLADEDIEATGDLAYKVEWHLRPIWAVIGSIAAAGLVFAALVLFTKNFVVSSALEEDVEMAGIGSFRRPASDYILDPIWDFSAPRRTREYKWTITDIVGNPDGVFRPMLTINGLFPGPMIECNEGDTLVIDIDNQSVNATSIHFHGLYQNGTNWMDGTAGITQCPIAPGRKFRYEFTVSGQSGSYYYHGHQAVQASDGLYGPLVIHARDEKELQKIPYETDQVIMLQDYYHDLSSGLLVNALEPGSEASPIPNGALINGLNQRDCSELPYRMCDNSTCTRPFFGLTANANHRLRFINVGAFAWFQVSVDEHEFAITEADGTDIIPTYDTRLMISPAQRYSMILNTDQSSANSFWLRAKMVTHCFKDPELPGPGADEVKAIIQYTQPGRKKTTKSLMSQPTSKNWNQGMEVQCKDMNTTSYIPANYEPAPAVADYSYYLRSNLEIGDWRLERGFFNTSTFRPNLQQPTLHRSVEGLTSRNETFTASSNIDGVNSVAYDLKNDFLIQHNGIKTIDLIIQNFDEGNHPMHLHGHKFMILGQGHGMFPGYQTLGLQPEGKGILEGHAGVLDNVMRRDVATAEGFGWLALRFIADNPGVWAFHCHMAWHSEAGLAMQFLDRVDEVANWEIPEANRELCTANIAELEKGAAPKDSTWFGFGIGG